MVGLGVMGRNLALNVLDHGYTVMGYNRSPESLARAVKESGGRLVGAGSLAELVDGLERPRQIMLMVKAGDPVDAVMGQLEPLLEPGDIVIDGGNSWYLDTRRREKQYAEARSALLWRRGFGRRGGGSVRTLDHAGRRPRGLPVDSAYVRVDRRTDRFGAVRHLYRARRCRAFRQDGTQRYRVRGHAVHR